MEEGRGLPFWVRIVGFVIGVLASFGVVLALFDAAHQGDNTAAWQLLVGGFVPFGLTLVMGSWFHRRGVPGRQRLTFLLSILVGFALGIGLLLLLG